MHELFNKVSNSWSEKYEKHDVTFTIHIFGDIKHFETQQRFRYVQHILVKQNNKKLHQNYQYQKMMGFLLKYIQKNNWKTFENLETDTESKESKSRTKKYGKTREMEHKKLTKWQNYTKHQKYHDEITKNMKSRLQINFLWFYNCIFGAWCKFVWF